MCCLQVLYCEVLVSPVELLSQSYQASTSCTRFQQQRQAHVTTTHLMECHGYCGPRAAEQQWSCHFPKMLLCSKPVSMLKRQLYRALSLQTLVRRQPLVCMCSAAETRLLCLQQRLTLDMAVATILSCNSRHIFCRKLLLV